MQSFTITDKDSGQTLIKYLNRLLPNSPGGLLFKQIRNKNITINGKKCTGNEKISSGDIINIFMADDTIAKFRSSLSVDVSEYRKAFNSTTLPRIIYEDENVILADKPVGMLSQKSDIKDMSINEWLIGYMLNKKQIKPEGLTFFTPSVCNRLDRNTGGIIIFGKTLHGSLILNRLIKERLVKKLYITLVKGIIKEPIFLKGFLKKDETTNKVTVKETAFEGADYIETSFCPLRHSKEYNLTELEVDLVTGKPHQIRAHLASIGHPVLGDNKYGDIAFNKSFPADRFIKNQFLYSCKMVFPDMEELGMLSGKTVSIDISDKTNLYFD